MQAGAVAATIWSNDGSFMRRSQLLYLQRVHCFGAHVYAALWLALQSAHLRRTLQTRLASIDYLHWATPSKARQTYVAPQHAQEAVQPQNCISARIEG